MVTALAVIFLISFLAACASRPPKQPPQIENAPVGKARVYIYRDSDAAPLRDVSILADGKSAAVLGNRQYVSILLAEGPHQISTKWSFEVSIPAATFSMTAASQNVSFLRLDITPDVRTITLMGSPTGSSVSNSGFGSRFIAQDRSLAYEGMSYCTRASGQ
jgi:hypothetical protein